MVKIKLSTCRVCLHSKGTVKIFDEYGTDEQFRFCTSLEVARNDGLPDKLCKICEGNLRLAYEFRSQAIYAEQYFRTTGNLEGYQAPSTSNELMELEENMHEIDPLLHPAKSYQESCVDAIDMPAIVVKTEDRTTSPSVMENWESCYAPDVEISIADNKPQCNLNNYERDETAKQQLENSNNLCASDKAPEKQRDKVVKEPKPVKKKSKNVKVDCNICGGTFTTIKALKQHLLKHSGERPFQCEFCKKSFTRSSILTIHRRLHTGERPYKCDECIATFVTRGALIRHKECEHREGTTDGKEKPLYECTTCNKVLCSKYSLKTHMRKHEIQSESFKGDKKKSSKYIYFCTVCQQRFTSKWALHAHQETHKSIQLFECDLCQNSFEKKYLLLEHLQTHENAESILNNCTDSLTKRSLETHSCSYCSKSFIKRHVLHMHQKACKISSESRMTYGKIYDPDDDHKSNILCNSSSEDFKCCICLMQFKKKFKWIFHMELHKYQKHRCKKCQETFAIKHQLLQHVKNTHFDKRNLDYQCNDCTSVLYDMRDLKLHINEVHGVPVKDLNSCNLCDCADFETAAEYYKHVHEAHDSVNKYCNECDEHFDSRRAFDTHVFTHYI